MKSVKILVNLVLVVAIFAVAGGVFYILMGSKTDPPQKDVEREGALVRVARVVSKPENMDITGFGTVEPKTDLLLVAQVSGRVEYLSPRLREGAMVKKKDLLLRIDPRTYRIAIDRAQAVVEQGDLQLKSLEREKKNLEADLALAKRELAPARREVDRAEKLLESQTGSEKARDVAEIAWLAVSSRAQAVENQLALWPSRYAAAEAAVKQSEAMLDEANLNLEYTEIKASFDGRVSERLVEAGQYVAPGTALARLYDSSPMEISLRVPMEDFNWVDTSCFFDSRRLEELPFDRPEALVRMRVRNHTCVWKGVVSRVDGQVDRATRTAGLIVEVRPEDRICHNQNNASSNPTGTNAEVLDGGGNGNPYRLDPDDIPHLALIPGLFVEVEIEGRRVERVFTLPRGVVDQDKWVYVAKDGKLEKREVEMLRADGGNAYVVGDLEDGDEVIVSPMTTPVEGMTLRIVGQEEKDKGQKSKGPDFSTSDGDK